MEIQGEYTPLNNLKNDNKKSEEVQHIIEKIPIRFGFWISMLVLGIVILIVTFGWVINYPDVVIGEITINANQSPIKLIAASPGKIKLLVKSQENIKAGQYIAYIQNSANFNDVMKLKMQLKAFNISNVGHVPNNIFASNLTLGDITAKYYYFINSFDNLRYYETDSLVSKQLSKLKTELDQENQNMLTSHQQVVYNTKNLDLYLKSYKRDSLLFVNNYESEDALDKLKASYFNLLQSQNQSIQVFRSNKERVDETENQIQQFEIMNREKALNLKLSLTSNYNDLLEAISSWEQKFAFVTPFNGQVQFLKFWNNDQYVQNAEELFTLVPEKNQIQGQLTLPSSGAGKVKIGQEVIIKLENYPYTEYGTIKGKVKSISLTPSTAKSKDQSLTNNYLVMVDLDYGLKTNYGTTIDFKFELKGSAEIITKERRLGSRLFDNLKNITEKDADLK